MIKSWKADVRMGVGGSEGRQKKSVRYFHCQEELLTFHLEERWV